MTRLAIRGHATRGKEVIDLLKMLGGFNSYTYEGCERNSIFTISNYSSIIRVFPSTDYAIFTLEEFFEKFPYKVGDEVIAYAEGCIAHFTIQDIRWNNESNKVEYKICSPWCDVSLIQPYKED